MNEDQELINQLFRKEFSRMVAVISKTFGLEHIEIAEDIVSGTFLQAMENWKGKGIPANPTAWLYTVAKNNTLQEFRRNNILTTKIIPELKSTQPLSIDEEEIDFSSGNIIDSQLQMMFAVCDEAIASEAQMALALRVLCGFGIDEIAKAFLTNKETVNKRLLRAKERLRVEQIRLEMPTASDIDQRLSNVLHIIYLLFNEGYYSTSHDQILRKEFCQEALRLGIMLSQFQPTNQPKTNALLALICFHASRFDARLHDESGFILYEDQDETLWDRELIKQGVDYLNKAATGDALTSYHLEAGIAYWHCQKEDTSEKWSNILYHYDLLMQVNNSPGVALNRAFAVYKVRGRSAALIEAEKLQLTADHFYYTLLGELYTNLDNKQAKTNYLKAISLASTETDRRTLQNKIDALYN